MKPSAIGCALAAWTILFLIPLPAVAHGGGLDSSGCHTNRKTGDYHCHRSSNVAAQRSALPPQNEAGRNSPARSDPTCYTGPRGGRYRIVNGKKRYGC